MPIGQSLAVAGRPTTARSAKRPRPIGQAITFRGAVARSPERRSRRGLGKQAASHSNRAVLVVCEHRKLRVAILKHEELFPSHLLVLLVAGSDGSFPFEPFRSRIEPSGWSH